MQFTLSAQAAPDAAPLYVFSDAARFANGDAAGLLAQSLGEKDCFAEAKIPVSGSLKSVAVLRLADWDCWDAAALQKAAREAAAWAQKQHAVSVDLNPFAEADAARAAEFLAVALGEAVYRFDRFKSEPAPAKLARAEFVRADDSSAVQAALSRAEALLLGMNLCKDLGNCAPNVCTPSYLAETAAAAARALGAEAKYALLLGRGKRQRAGAEALGNALFRCGRPIRRPHRAGRQGADV